MKAGADGSASVGRVVLLERRVPRLDTSVEALAGKLSDTSDRVIRLEGLIEDTVRNLRSDPPRPLPPPR